MEQEELYYILSLERCERGAGKFWWKVSEWGYTDDLALAGKFTRTKAFDICRMAGRQDLPIPVEAMGE